MSFAYFPARKITDLKQMLRKSRMDFGERAAFAVKTGKEEKKEISYEAFTDDVDALGTKLCAMGLRHKHIAILSENRYEWITAYLAVANGTGVVVPIDRELPEESIAYLLEAGDVEAIFYSAAYADIVQNLHLDKVNHAFCFDENSYHHLIEDGKALLQGGEQSFMQAVIDPEQCTAILFTSGTTGFSKGVMLSHHNFAAVIMGAASIEQYADREVMLSVLPYHHSFECIVGIMASLCYGATICINDSLKYLAKNMALFRPTAMFSVPALIYAMLQRMQDAEKKLGRKLTAEEAKMIFGGRLRRIFSGSAPLNTALIPVFAKYGIALCQGYGLTETAPIVTTMRYALLDAQNSASVGIPIPQCEIRIVDEEIQVKGENVMLGYYHNPAATAEVMDNGWFKTGDLGRLDERGYLYLHGRKKNVIIGSGGENVYPEEIEQYLYSIPLIADALVYGGADGNTVTAVIYPNEHAEEADIEAAVRKAISAVNEKLPLYKHIAKVAFRANPFVKTTSGKVKRDAVNFQEE